MESIVIWFTNTFGGVLSREAAVFIISLLPILECRGGLLASKLLALPLLRAPNGNRWERRRNRTQRRKRNRKRRRQMLRLWESKGA